MIVDSVLSQERRRKTVLIVEDDMAISEAISLAVSHEGYTTAVAADGTQALELLGKLKVDLILTDLAMKPMPGKELLARLEKDPALRTIPVIVISGEVDIQAIADGRKPIQKPFRRVELLKAVEDALR